MGEDRTLSVSALMDGELPPAKAQRAVDAMLQDPALKKQWADHHAISDALNGQHSAGADLLAERVRDALDAEPVPLKPPPARKSGSTKHRLALAASVAAVAIVTTLTFRGLSENGIPDSPSGVTAGSTPTHETPHDTPTPSADTTTIVTASVDDSATRLSWGKAQPQVEQRLNGYLLTHNEYLATGVRGMLPYARVVGYEPQD